MSLVVTGFVLCGRNKFFRVSPNISQKLVPGGTGVQIKRDRSTRLDRNYSRKKTKLGSGLERF